MKVVVEERRSPPGSCSLEDLRGPDCPQAVGDVAKSPLSSHTGFPTGSSTPAPSCRASAGQSAAWRMPTPCCSLDSPDHPCRRCLEQSAAADGAREEGQGCSQPCCSPQPWAAVPGCRKLRPSTLSSLESFELSRGGAFPQRGSAAPHPSPPMSCSPSSAVQRGCQPLTPGHGRAPEPESLC